MVLAILLMWTSPTWCSCGDSQHVAQVRTANMLLMWGQPPSAVRSSASSTSPPRRFASTQSSPSLPSPIP